MSSRVTGPVWCPQRKHTLQRRHADLVPTVGGKLLKHLTFTRERMVFLRKESVLRSRARVFIAGIRVAGFPFENCRPLWKLPLPPPSFMNLREKYPEERCPVMTFLPKRIPNWLEELKVMTIFALESQNSRVATQNWVPQTFPFSDTFSVNCQCHLEIQWHRQDSALAFYLLYFWSTMLPIHDLPNRVWAQLPCK